MKLALITDIHGNREAFEACFDAACKAGAEKFALLGDFVGYGADPAWVVSQVQALVAEGAIAVRGNHDEAAVMGPTPTMMADALRVVDWTSGQLSGAQRQFLAALPYTVRQDDLLFAHANANAPEAWGYVMGTDDAALSLKATRARHTFVGHMHDPCLYRLTPKGSHGRASVVEMTPETGLSMRLPPDRQWLVLPGSAGQPRDGNTAACWALFDTESCALTLQRTPYDHEKAAAKIVCAGLPKSLAQRLLRGN